MSGTSIIAQIFVPLTLKETDILCICLCIPDSFKMGTGDGELESVLYNFSKGCIYEDSLNQL